MMLKNISTLFEMRTEKNSRTHEPASCYCKVSYTGRQYDMVGQKQREKTTLSSYKGTIMKAIDTSESCAAIKMFTAQYSQRVPLKTCHSGKASPEKSRISEGHRYCSFHNKNRDKENHGDVCRGYTLPRNRRYPRIAKRVQRKTNTP
jgi:hypothetical protein